MPQTSINTIPFTSDSHELKVSTEIFRFLKGLFLPTPSEEANLWYLCLIPMIASELLRIRGTVISNRFILTFTVLRPTLINRKLCLPYDPPKRRIKFHIVRQAKTRPSSPPSLSLPQTGDTEPHRLPDLAVCELHRLRPPDNIVVMILAVVVLLKHPR